MCAVLSVVVVVTFILFYNKIFAVTFDENFSKAAGTNANGYNLIVLYEKLLWSKEKTAKVTTRSSKTYCVNEFLTAVGTFSSFC